jgi:putative DNA primase/helicase
MNNNNVLSMPPPQKKPLVQAIENLTDVTNAERFVGKYTGVLIHVPQRGVWLEFQGHCWHPDESRQVIQRAIVITNEMLVEAKQIHKLAMKERDENIQAAILRNADRLRRHACTSQSKSKLESLVALSATFPDLTKSQSMLDNNDLLFGVQNGVIELDATKFREGKPEDLITKQSEAHWLGDDSITSCPNFEAFLSEVQPDPEVRRWIQKYCGYSLSGSTVEQIFAVFQGIGANGKGVFVDLISRVSGAYCKTVQFDSFCETNKSSIRNDIAALDKIRLVIANEGPESAILDEGIIKQITGEDEVSARFLHREFFEFSPRFKVILVTNHKPVIKGTDHGIWRRVILVPWPVVIPSENRDKHLKQKLSQELPGILAWCIKGYQLWQMEGLGKLPKALINANSEYRNESDIVGLWIEECCESIDGFFSTSSTLYDSYRSWASNSGYRPISQKTLGEKFRERGLTAKKNGGIRGWIGIRVIPLKSYY